MSATFFRLESPLSTGRRPIRRGDHANLSLSKHLLSSQLRVPEFLVVSQSRQLALLLESLELILQRFYLSSQIFIPNIYQSISQSASPEGGYSPTDQP